MPRARREEVDNVSLKPSDIEEDYLDIDKPFPGQNYYCISFVSPDKVIQNKEFHLFYHYEQAFYKKIHKMLDDTLTTIIDNCPDGKVDISDIVKLKKEIVGACKNEQVEFPEFQTRFEDFRFRDEEKIGELFDKMNNFRTSVRGVKVRGVFDTKREADVRAAVLQRLDANFDVFVGQIGYWCPWDPNPQKIDDIEYLNSDLNKLVKEYKANEAKKDQFYQEQKTQRQKDALSAEERLKHQQGLAEMNTFQNQQRQAQQQQSIAPGNTGITELTGITGDLLEGGASSLQASVATNLNPIINTGKSICDDIENMVKITENDSSITQSIRTGGSDSTLDAEAQQMQGVDPWLARKMNSQN
jgi:hypothetical protein